jgi:hypothetical protein
MLEYGRFHERKLSSDPSLLFRLPRPFLLLGVAV